MRLLAYFANGFCIGIAASQGNWLALIGWIAAIVWMALYLSAERDSGGIDREEQLRMLRDNLGQVTRVAEQGKVARLWNRWLTTWCR